MPGAGRAHRRRRGQPGRRDLDHDAPREYTHHVDGRAGGVLVMNGSLEDSLAVTADSLLLFMGGFSPGLGHGTSGDLVILTHPDIADTTDRPSLDYLPGTLVEP